MVLSADGTPLGEAFVHLHGPRAKMRLALSRDRATMPVRGAGGEGGGPMRGAWWAGQGRRKAKLRS